MLKWMKDIREKALQKVRQIWKWTLAQKERASLRVDERLEDYRRADFYQKMTFRWIAIMGFLTLVWLYCDGGWEPVVTFAGIMAALSAFFLEPGYRARQEQVDVLNTVLQETDEADIALRSLNRLSPSGSEDRDMFYPRLRHDCLDRALNSQTFTMKHDPEIWVEFWHARSIRDRFNRYLSFLEFAMWQGIALDASDFPHPENMQVKSMFKCNAELKTFILNGCKKNIPKAVEDAEAKNP